MSRSPLDRTGSPPGYPIIVVEGLDGTGKTTLSRALAERLGGVWLTTPDERLRPHRQPFDDAWRDSPDSSQLFYAATVLDVGLRALSLRRSAPVVIDRYWSSTRAYAGVNGASLSLGEVERALPPADLTLVVTLDEEERVRRLQARGMTALDASTLGPRSRALAAALARPGPWSGTVRRLDTTGLDPETALSRALDLVAELCADCSAR